MRYKKIKQNNYIKKNAQKKEKWKKYDGDH